MKHSKQQCRKKEKPAPLEGHGSVVVKWSRQVGPAASPKAPDGSTQFSMKIGKT